MLFKFGKVSAQTLKYELMELIGRVDNLYDMREKDHEEQLIKELEARVSVELFLNKHVMVVAKGRNLSEVLETVYTNWKLEEECPVRISNDPLEGPAPPGWKITYATNYPWIIIQGEVIGGHQHRE